MDSWTGSDKNFILSSILSPATGKHEYKEKNAGLKDADMLACKGEVIHGPMGNADKSTRVTLRVESD